MDLGKKLANIKAKVEQSEQLKNLASEAQNKLGQTGRKAAELRKQVEQSDTFQTITEKTAQGLQRASKTVADFNERVKHQPENSTDDPETRQAQPIIAPTPSPVMTDAERNATTTISNRSNMYSKIPQRDGRDRKKFLLLVTITAAALLLAVASFIVMINSHDTTHTTPMPRAEVATQVPTETTTSLPSATQSEATDTTTPDTSQPPATQTQQPATINTASLKGQDATKAIGKVKAKQLPVVTLITDGVDTTVDKTDYVLTNTSTSIKWVVTNATQNADGSVKLEVKTTITGPITAQNNPEFAALLNITNTSDPTIKAFAEKYKNKTIEFDGNLSNILPDERYSNSLYLAVLVGAGDYSETTSRGPNFHFENVNPSSFGISGTYFPEYATQGHNVHIVAKVRVYDTLQELLRLDPISVTAR
jgi:hypothetical protein